MKQVDTLLHSANILVSTIGVMAADGLLPGASALIGGAMSVRALLGAARPKTDDLDKRVGKMLAEALKYPTTHLPKEADMLIPQMIEAGALTHAEVMATARDPAKICAAMLGKLTDPDHKRIDMQQAFGRVVTPIFTTLLGDTEVCNMLRPAFELALAGTLQNILQVVERLEIQLEKTARKLGVQDGLLIALARRYAEGNPGDFDSALAGVEQALKVTAAERDKGRLPGNVPDAVTAVMARVDELNAEGQIDEGMAELRRVMQDQSDVIAQAQAVQLRLIDRGLAQVVLTRDVDMAVTLELEKLGLDGGVGFDALRGVWIVWYERGRDKGLRFDLEVAIALALASEDRAGDADQRGTAANDLGTALATLGERESGPERLEQAVAAYECALLEWTHARVPLDWAGTQNNLGNALKALGARESGPERLEQAVAAYERALQEYPRERVPFNWAVTQENLARVEVEIAMKSEGAAVVAHLRAALGYVEAALEVFDPQASAFYCEKANRLRENLLAELG